MCVGLTVLLVSGVVAQAPPSLPMQWLRKGTQVNALPLPPWDVHIPVPSIVTPMQSYYDWSLKRLREDYQDSCVPIFQNGSMWSCSFLNVDATSYLLQYEDRPLGQPECCIFLKPWNPPAPDFGSTLFYLKNSTPPEAAGDTIMWWQSKGVTPAEGGPFGYGWRYPREGGAPFPWAFYFGGFWNRANGTVAGSNIVQYYSGFSDTTPPASTWAVPASCAAAAACNNFGAPPASKLGGFGSL